MNNRSKIDQLPAHIREAFERELLTRNFRGYDDIEAWLNRQLQAEGLAIVISRSAAARFGQDFQGRCETIRLATEQAKAIVSVVGDDEGSMNEALIRLIQQMTFDILLKAGEAGEGIAEILPKVGVMVAKLSKASVDQKKWAVEMRKKTAAAADDIARVVKKGGLSDQAAEEIRRKILGIAA